MKTPTAPTHDPDVKKDRQSRKEAKRSQAALENTRQGYGTPQNDRSAGNRSGESSQGGARDMTSGKRSGNQ